MSDIIFIDKNKVNTTTKKIKKNTTQDKINEQKVIEVIKEVEKQKREALEKKKKEAKKEAMKETKKEANKEANKDAMKEANKEAMKEAKTGAKKETKTGAKKETKTGAKKETKTGATKEEKKETVKVSKIDFNKEIEFDPFEIYPEHLESNKPILLVDLGFTTFYRFNATKNWYTHAHPEEKDIISADDYEWFDNKEFMDKFKKRYVETLLDVAKNYKIPKHNIILAQDCSSCDNWRGKLYENYKLQRKLARSKKGFDGAKVFEDAFNNLFPSIAKNYGFKLIKHNEIESDDINAIIAKYYQIHYPNLKIYILATDKDYFQLTNDNTHLIDFSNKIINQGKNGEFELWYKIFTGDKSDNIPAVKFKKGLVSENIKSGHDIYINANNEIATKYANNIELFFNDLKQNPDLVRQNQLDLNRQLIDFNYIPSTYQTDVIKMLHKYMHHKK
jgi:hypothetical protein